MVTVESLQQSAPSRIPRLEPGDHLTREEFERRYAAMPGLKQAELIEGVVFMPSPVRHDQHSGPHARLITLLGIYQLATPGVDVGDNATLRLDADNEPQPDGFLRIESECGGQCALGADGYLVGGPELVAEIAYSSASYDLHEKRNAYRRNGVLEYIVWRVAEQAIDWFLLEAGRYEPLPPDEHGVFRSRVFPGLWLDGLSLLRGDGKRAEECLEQGIASPEHAAFVKRLEAAKAKQP